jgi:hypothetical protein
MEIKFDGKSEVPTVDEASTDEDSDASSEDGFSYRHINGALGSKEVAIDTNRNDEDDELDGHDKVM